MIHPETLAAIKAEVANAIPLMAPGPKVPPIDLERVLGSFAKRIEALEREAAIAAELAARVTALEGAAEAGGDGEHKKKK
jgi:hypothetical protein